MPVVRVAALVLGLLSATLVHAASQRTFVASTGVDTNTAFNCSIVKPCRGFAAAIGVTSAKGEVIVLDSAAYGVIPAITQSVTITAPAGIYAGISVFSGDGITINAGINDTVVLRGLTINGQGGANGITITNALVVHVENCVIANLTGIGINHLNGLLEMKDTIVRDNGNIGVYVQGPAQANLDRVRLEGNDTGLAVEIGGVAAMQDGVVTGSGNAAVVVTNTVASDSQVTISRSLISSNNFGIYADGAGAGTAHAFVTIYESAISGNTVGVHVSSNLKPFTGRALLKHNVVTTNETGLEVVNAGQAIIDGNYISSNYVLDLNLDSVSIVGTLKTNFVAGINAMGVIISQVPF